METIIVSLICIALIVFGGMTMSQGFLTSVDTSTAGLSEIGQRDETIIRTLLTPISTNQTNADTLEVVLENTGQTRLADFSKWDVFVHYHDGDDNYYIKWLPYTESTPTDNEWELAWIKLDGGDEVYEPEVLNPGEQLMLRCKLNPEVGVGTTNLVVVSTPSGITALTYFYY